VDASPQPETIDEGVSTGAVGPAEKTGTRRRKSLSDKQLSILDAIQGSIASRGYPPSMREIGDAVGLSSLSSVTHQLNQLELVGKGDLFMLKVSGDSMIDAAICDGDWIVVRQQKTAENGDIVAALLDDEATVKVFQQRDGHTWLLPRNSAFAPILGDFAEVLGKVVAVLRSV